MLEHKGVMSHKLSVQATDDVYKTTRERMAQAEEEVKRNWWVDLVTKQNMISSYSNIGCVRR